MNQDKTVDLVSPDSLWVEGRCNKCKYFNPTLENVGRHRVFCDHYNYVFINRISLKKYCGMFEVGGK